MESRKLFLKAFDTYEKAKQNQNDAIPQLREIELDIKRLTALEAVIEAFLTADRLIVSELQAAITTQYPALCPILKESIRLPITEEELTNPWDMKNLAGMAAIIYNTYHKPSFITFNNNLIKAIGFQITTEECKTNPMKAVASIQELIFTWDTQKLWARMSPDHFWTACLLRSLPSPSLFSDQVSSLAKFSRFIKLETDIFNFFCSKFYDEYQKWQKCYGSQWLWLLLHHRLCLTEDELFERIRGFSHGYIESGNHTILNNRISNSIDANHILPSVLPTNKIEDVGHWVYLTIQDLLRAVDSQ